MLTGLTLLIVQKEINNPRGIDKINVNIKSKQVTLKPSIKFNVICEKVISFPYVTLAEPKRFG